MNTRAFSLQDIFVMIVGVGLAAWGAWDLPLSYARLMGTGLFLVGVGTIAFGGTRGFTSYTIMGRTTGSIGIGAYLIGIPVLFYWAWTRI